MQPSRRERRVGFPLGTASAIQSGLAREEHSRGKNSIIQADGQLLSLRQEPLCPCRTS